MSLTCGVIGDLQGIIKTRREKSRASNLERDGSTTQERSRVASTIAGKISSFGACCVYFSNVTTLRAHYVCAPVTRDSHEIRASSRKLAQYMYTHVSTRVHTRACRIGDALDDGSNVRENEWTINTERSPRFAAMWGRVTVCVIFCIVHLSHFFFRSKRARECHSSRRVAKGMISTLALSLSRMRTRADILERNKTKE